MKHLTNEQHAKIFYAYLARVKRADLKRIIEADDDVWHAWANYGTSSQLQAQENMHNVVLESVENITTGDIENLERIIGGLINE